MSTFNGIPISEHRVLAHSIICLILFFGFTVAVGFWIYVSWTSKNPKKRQHLRKLKEKAKNDENARKRLEKIERKNKRRMRRDKDNIIMNIVICVAVCLAVMILDWGIISGWTDYIKKDYVVYTGEIRVYNHMRRPRIYLEDGTIIWGRGDFTEADTYGTVVYSRRTRYFLGGGEQ